MDKYQKDLTNQIFKNETFHVIIERTLITPSDPPKATRGPSTAVVLERNTMLQEIHKTKQLR